ncbi:MAG: PadR family transcriptional regulator [Solirubrobacterales bacterium]
MPEQPKDPADDAATEVTRAVASTARQRKGGGRPSDVFGGEIRRRDVFPLLVLHLVSQDRSYGNEMIHEIERITDGVISVNPNTMYPLLRDMEARELLIAEWEHPEKRTRRYYRITDEGRREYLRLVEEVEPFLDSVINAIVSIKREVYDSAPEPPS